MDSGNKEYHKEKCPLLWFWFVHVCWWNDSKGMTIDFKCVSHGFNQKVTEDNCYVTGYSPKPQIETEFGIWISS